MEERDKKITVSKLLLEGYFATHKEMLKAKLAIKKHFSDSNFSFKVDWTGKEKNIITANTIKAALKN